MKGKELVFVFKWTTFISEQELHALGIVLLQHKSGVIDGGFELITDNLKAIDGWTISSKYILLLLHFWSKQTLYNHNELQIL